MTTGSDENMKMQAALIVVYDDLLSAPRMVEIPPSDVTSYIEGIASKTYELAQAQGGTIPYTVIREVSENFIHAHFKDPVVSILDGGNTIRFTDQGPGIEDKSHAQLPGFTSATEEMKRYIRGVGSGFPIVKEYLRFSNGRLVIEDNLEAGAVVTITINDSENPTPVVYRETQQTQTQVPAQEIPRFQLDERERAVLVMARESSVIGPTDVGNKTGISVTTSYRVLTKLQNEGLLADAGNGKRRITEKGLSALSG